MPTGGRRGVCLAAFFLLIFGACSERDGFDEGQRTPGPEEPICPETSDCSEIECGPDPICGLECGPCSDEASCIGEGECCVPQTCEDTGNTCGDLDDGCGGLIQCGVCSSGLVCASEDGGGTSCSCPSAAEGESVWIDISTSAVVLQPRLNNTLPSAENTNLESHPNFLLRPLYDTTGSGWHRVRLNLLDESTEEVRPELDFRVIPGNYALYYEFRGSSKDGLWPLNSRFMIDEQLSITGDATVPVEVPSALVTLNLQIDGVPLSEMPLQESQVIEVRIEGGGGGITLAHLEGDDPEASWILPSVRLIPAGYQVMWSNNLGSEHAPLSYGYNSHLPLGGGSAGDPVGVSATDSELQIDIETAEVTFALLQDGQSLAELGLAAADDPRLLLLGREPTAPQGEEAQQDYRSLDPRENIEVELPPFWDPVSGSSTNTLSLRMLPGNYDVVYSHTSNQDDPLDGAERRWALNRALLDDNVTVYPSAEFSWNIESATVAVDVLLNGQALNETTCSGASPELRLLWAEAFPGKRRTNWRLPDICPNEPGPPRTPYSIRLVAGSYDLQYLLSDDSADPSWPKHEAAVSLDAGRRVDGETPLNVDIPVVVLDLNITTDGTQPPPPGEGVNLGEWPHIELSELGMDSSKSLGCCSWTASVAVPLEPNLSSLLLIPSRYRIAYLARNIGQGPDWPNASYGVDTSVVIDDDMSLSYDLDTRRVGIQLSLNGTPSDAANTGLGDHGKLTLVRANPQGSFSWVSSWRDEKASLAPQFINLPPGHYQFLYYPAGYEHSQVLSFETLEYGGQWPVNSGTYAGCIDVE